MSAEVRYMAATSGLGLSGRQSDELMRQLQILQLADFIKQYRGKWNESVDRINSDTIPENDLCLGRPLKQWNDSILS
jgi:hypothetical protein